MSQNSQETPVPEKTPVDFAEFLRTPVLQNNSGRLLPKRGHFNNEARDIDCICCRELDVTIQFLWESARLLVTVISLI